MNRANARVWLHAWFAERATLPEPATAAEANYFEAQWIDSLSVIELIEAVEANFGIKFGEMHFQDRRFQSIAGLAEIIEELSGRRAGR